MGARAKSKINDFDYRIEYTKEETDFSGGTTDLSGAQYDLELGYVFTSLKGLRVALEYFVADEDYRQLYPLAHAYLGHADVLGRTNVSGYSFKGAINTSEKTKIVATYHTFTRENTDKQVFKANGSSYAVNSTSDDLGQEIDIDVTYALNPTSTFVLGGAIFSQGQYFKDASEKSDDDLQWAYFQYIAKF